jgi:DNA repair protein RadC
LELVLFRAIPRQDIKPLARTLIEIFGDFSGVLTATHAQLLAMKTTNAYGFFSFNTVEVLRRKRAFMSR